MKTIQLPELMPLAEQAQPILFDYTVGKRTVHTIKEDGRLAEKIECFP